VLRMWLKGGEGPGEVLLRPIPQRLYSGERGRLCPRQSHSSHTFGARRSAKQIELGSQLSVITADSGVRAVGLEPTT
jgi:hypothetical protein